MRGRLLDREGAEERVVGVLLPNRPVDEARVQRIHEADRRLALVPIPVLVDLATHLEAVVELGGALLELHVLDRLYRTVHLIWVSRRKSIDE